MHCSCVAYTLPFQYVLCSVCGGALVVVTKQNKTRQDTNIKRVAKEKGKKIKKKKKKKKILILFYRNVAVIKTCLEKSKRKQQQKDEKTKENFPFPPLNLNDSNNNETKIFYFISVQNTFRIVSQEMLYVVA